MVGSTRRMVLRGISGVCVAAGLGIMPAMAAGLTRVPLPQGPMRLIRRLERDLRGNETLTVEREWVIEFAPQGQGIAIRGMQVAVAVDAPESLGALAQIEERRQTDGMWPILLGDNGLILASRSSMRREDVAAAVDEAERMIAAREIPVAVREQQQELLLEVQNAGAAVLNQLPEDLFYPVGETMRAVRELDLPGGVRGQFEVSYQASSSATGGWLQTATRRIVTRIGESERQAVENWSLLEAA